RIARNYLANCYNNRAILLDHLGRHADAIPDWDKAIQLASGPAIEPRWRRAMSIARSGDHVRAASVAEEMVGGSLPPADLVRVAGVFVVNRDYVKFDTEVREKYAVRAIQLLERAVQLGYRDREALASDATLAPIRFRPDFQRLLKELEPKK